MNTNVLRGGAPASSALHQVDSPVFSRRLEGSVNSRILCCPTQERKDEGAKQEAAGDGKGDAGVPAEAQDLTVFVQSVMEQMVRVNGRSRWKWQAQHEDPNARLS